MTYPLPGKLRVSQVVKACCMDAVEYIDFMQNPPAQTEVMMRGTILHSLILERKQPGNIALLDFANFRTKAAQKARDAALAAGKVIMKPAELEVLKTRITPAIVEYFAGCEVEKPFTGYLDGFGEVQGKLDARLGKHIKDLKTTEANFFKDVNGNIFKRGYDLQLYLYMKLCRAESAEIVLFECNTGCWQTVNFDLGELEYSCQTRLVRGLANYNLWKTYRQGQRHLAQSSYALPFWAVNHLLDLEEKENDARTYEDTTKAAKAC